MVYVFRLQQKKLRYSMFICLCIVWLLRLEWYCFAIAPSINNLAMENVNNVHFLSPGSGYNLTNIFWVFLILTIHLK